MDFKIGKTYSVQPLYKKCFVESETFIHCDDPEQKMVVNILWRNGCVNVTPQNQEEVDILEAANYAEDGDEFEPYQFEDAEFLSTWDGVSVDIDFVGNQTDEQKESLEEGYDEEGFSFLEEEGYDSDESNVVMHGELEIFEFEGYDA